MMNNGLFCKYYSLVFFAIYFFSYKKIYEKTKLNIKWHEEEKKVEVRWMPYKDLIIINNEKIFIENDNFYCDNLDLKILPE